MSRYNKRSDSLPAGFTIVELLIVIVVIAILAAIIIVSYNGIISRTHDATLKTDLRNATNKLEMSTVTDGTYPGSESAADNGKGLPKSKGTKYQYTYDPSGNTFCLTATSDNLPGKAYHTSSTNRAVQDGPCTGHLAGGASNEPSSCPSGYIAVPGNATFGTSGGFCVMKYEAKDGGGTAVSIAAGQPALGFSYDYIKPIAEASCSGCHVITENEWMTIAANVLSVPSNWSGGSVGSGYIFSGHSDNSPSSALAATTNDSDGYNGTGDNASDSGVTGGMTGISQRRTLTLTNGQVIWDFAGNAWEWTSSTITGGTQPGFAGDNSYSFKQWNSGSLQMNGLLVNSRPSSISSQVATWSSAQGIGTLYSNRNDSLTTVYQRSGGWGYGTNVGVLSLALDVSPSVGDGDVGTRLAK